ncbi:MAG: hypothetical protein ABW186_16390 [Rhodanobacteraceae bacterium]
MSIESVRGDRRALLAIVAVLLLCIFAYVRGLFGGFLFDDFGAIVENLTLRSFDGSGARWAALALSSDSGVLHRPLSMLSFGIDYLLFGLDPLAFKIVNLAIHLANGLLLYVIAKRLVPRLCATDDAGTRVIAIAVMALWLLHPLNVGSVVYVVQRMNLLAVLFMLAGLLCHVDGRERIARGQRGLARAIFGLTGFGILAVLAKENGALIFAYALIVEAVCYRFAAPTKSERTTLSLFFAVTVLLPVLAFLLYTAVRPAWIESGYAERDFTLVGRLLTEPRVICDYLVWILLPLPRWMGVYHDDIAISTGLFSPLSTFVSIGFLVVLVAVAWRLRKRTPALAFAVGWFLVGHSMESTVLPLELAFDHRNYLPMAGLILGIVCLVAPWLRGRLGALAFAVVAIVFAATTASWAYAWGDPLRLALAQAHDHPDSARAQYEAGRRTIFDADSRGRRAEGEKIAIAYFERSQALDPTDMFSAASLIRARAAGKPGVPDEAIDDLARRAKTIKLAHVNPLLSLITAATAGELPLNDEQMGKLVYSALDNPVYPPLARAMLLSDYGQYKFLIAHDGQSAVVLTLAAAAEDPQNPLFQINLVKLALAIGETRKAAEHLAIAQRLDRIGVYAAAIADLQQRLATMLPPDTQ